MPAGCVRAKHRGLAEGAEAILSLCVWAYALSRDTTCSRRPISSVRSEERPASLAYRPQWATVSSI